VKRVLVATKNAGKLRELRQIFARAGIDVDEWPAYADVAEGETSYAENAALKARALWEQLEAAGVSVAVLGDDSGLEVAALGGRPGVLSARYGGAAATWPERRRALLGELEGSGSRDRRARFVCALHLIRADGGETAVRADVEGAIARVERGEGGFSYDALFELPQRGLTFAEMPEEEKNRLSHRARAVAALLSASGDASTATPEPAASGGN
jgi:XTP/dITP diphosphohydrolase